MFSLIEATSIQDTTKRVRVNRMIRISPVRVIGADGSQLGILEVDQALRMAGHDPEVVKVRGLGIGPRFLHLMTDGRREVERISGQRAVPVLVTDDDRVVTDSARIIEWAEANPAHRTG